MLFAVPDAVMVNVALPPARDDADSGLRAIAWFCGPAGVFVGVGVRLALHRATRHAVTRLGSAVSRAWNAYVATVADPQKKPSPGEVELGAPWQLPPFHRSMTTWLVSPPVAWTRTEVLTATVTSPWMKFSDRTRGIGVGVGDGVQFSGVGVGVTKVAVRHGETGSPSLNARNTREFGLSA